MLMSETVHGTGGTGPSHRSVEAGVAVVVGVLGLITVLGSLRVGIGWGDEGPKAGFFPFYIGLIIIISSVINLVQLLATERDSAVFATWDQIYKVLTVVIPTAVYVAIIPFAGIYVASALLIGLFMLWLGKYSAFVTIPTAIAVPIFFFVVFERWFLVPLPKGPIERLLGF
jgi:putative tricarboxylic transport membrane protein